MEERIITLHPEGKRGVNISLARYQAVRRAILTSLADGRDLTFAELGHAVEQSLQGFAGSITWYYTCVKLDLEAREEIKCVRSPGAQTIRLGDP